jgi:RNA polymerase sigma-70 factor (ECF subfamily)
MNRASRWDQEPDDALVGRIQSDPEEAVRREALDVLIERWSTRVFHWALRFVRDREGALDLAQECLLAMIGALPRYQPGGRFGAWLYTIVHNRCRKHVRPRSLHRDPEIDADELASANRSPEEDLDSREGLRRLLASMDSALEPRERAALWLRAVEGMSVDEITQVLGIDGPSGARAVLQTARRKLHAELARVPGRSGVE